ncbi:MAG TPA: Rieske 2Fe-2S domain-containing protein [Jatrophihabitans sp.]|jgi:nitrite reductase/ring-hydroxylating ferredoxin subunit/uncharacterized membrane protein
MRSAVALDRAVDRLERASWLDQAADAISAGLRKVIKPGPTEDVLSGTALAHPAHPMLVAVPIGAWTSATVLDCVGGNRATTRGLVALGTIAALPAAATGASDWLSTAQAERRVGLVHAAANACALGLQIASWRARRRGRVTGAMLSAAALALTSVAGWLGGHLAYAQGVGVDTTVFQLLPTEWTDLCAPGDITDKPARHDVNGVPVVAYRTGSDVVVLADRCTHRGGPLHEGFLDAAGCITCPWHGSTFDNAGRVVSGPATRPQPALDVRVENGRVQVRRDEQRALRLNPVS